MDAYPPPPRIVFAGSPQPTLGVEVELQVIDPESRGLVNAAPRVLEAFEGDPHVTPELLEAVIEINTAVCKDVTEVREDLRMRLEQVSAEADRHGLVLSATGTHPYSSWSELRVSDDPRYRQLVDRMQWLARRFVIFGLHVHVGVSDGEKAIAICNSVTGYLPILLGLSASSPYWLGQDTGLASCRVKLFEALPTAGLPYHLTNWNEFVRFMTTFMNSGAVESIREVWWDVRPHLGFGTIEVRICDGVNTLGEIVSVVALVQSLVVWLGEKYDRGEELPLLKSWTLRENKWRAARWGNESRIIVNEHGFQKPFEEKLEELISDLTPVANRLGCSAELHGVRRLAVNPSFKRQRAVFEETGSLDAVVDACVQELKTDTPTSV